jgi:FkbM family methyltransferase
VSDNTRPQVLRRDFLVGSAVGIIATSSATLLTNEWLRYPEGMIASYAQSGEDVIVAGILDQFHLTRTTYLDVGAFRPIYANNTYIFYQKGSRGVLVEPNIDLIPELRAKRPGDTVLNVGVGLTEQSAADYYCLSLPEWNTFDKAEAERRVAANGGKVKIERVVKMPLIPINRIMAEHFPPNGPDFLSIDIESLDLAVLQTIDFTRFRPKVMCVETLIPMTFRMEPAITKFLASQGYEVRGMTCVNTIYIDQSHLG